MIDRSSLLAAVMLCVPNWSSTSGDLGVFVYQPSGVGGEGRVLMLPRPPVVVDELSRRLAPESIMGAADELAVQD